VPFSITILTLSEINTNLDPNYSPRTENNIEQIELSVPENGKHHLRSNTASSPP